MCTKYIEHSIVSIIADSIVHSELDYCKSLYYYNLSKSEIYRIHDNVLTRTVVKASKFKIFSYTLLLH